MFGLDPLNPVVAIVEIMVLMAVAALIGWLLGRLVRGGRVAALRSAIAAKEQELAACRQERNGSSAAVSDADAPQALIVPADPLLPAFSHDDRPELVDASTGRPVTDVRTTLAAESTDVLNKPLPNEEEESEEEKPVRLPPIEVPPLGAPIPEAPAVLPPTPATSVVSTGAASTSAVSTGGASAGGVGTTEATVLNRVAARAGEINFDRIGRATPTEADDLKDIVGIGPFLERKLHSIGIYTFRQVANFTKEDVKKVNEIIEFFPGRIEDDNWVGQAKTFHERKYGTGQ